MGVTPWEFKSPLRHRVAATWPNPFPGDLSGNESRTRERARLWTGLDFDNRGRERKDDRWPGGLEESPSCRERGCPVKAGAASQRRQSRLARGQPRESNRDQTGFAVPQGGERRVKRAILPAAISDPAAIRLLAEAESREQSPGDPATGPNRTERDDHQEQNSAYSPFASSSHGAFSSIGRAPVCGTGGHGFEPRKAPLEKPHRYA